MRTFLQLVHMELHRFRHFLFGLMAITVLVQVGATVALSLNEIAMRDPGKQAQNESFSPVSLTDFVLDHPMLYALPILLCIFSLVLYVFLIWYRDWLGRNTFVYRLFMLPSARRHLFLSKLSAIVLFVFVLVAWQWLLIFVNNGVFTAIMPDEYEATISIRQLMENYLLFQVLYPPTLERFILYYGTGIIAVMVMFAAVLLERSRRGVGLIYALLYAGGAAVMNLFMLFAYETRLFRYLYAHEMLWINTGILLATAAVSVWLGFRLLERNVSV